MTDDELQQLVKERSHRRFLRMKAENRSRAAYHQDHAQRLRTAEHILHNQNT